MGKLWLSGNNGCWLRVWDAPQLRGSSKTLAGPADFPQLRIADESWNATVESLVVGPDGYVLLYEETNLTESAVWLLPNQEIANFSKLECGEELDSLRIFDRPPYAQEATFAAYQRAIAKLAQAVTVSEHRRS